MRGRAGRSEKLTPPQKLIFRSFTKNFQTFLTCLYSFKKEIPPRLGLNRKPEVAKRRFWRDMTLPEFKNAHFSRVRSRRYRRIFRFSLGFGRDMHEILHFCAKKVLKNWFFGIFFEGGKCDFSVFFLKKNNWKCILIRSRLDEHRRKEVKYIWTPEKTL